MPDGGIKDIPAPVNPTESRVVELAAVQQTELKPDDRIAGINTLRDLDQFADMVSTSLCGHTLSDRLWDTSFPAGHTRHPKVKRLLSTHFVEYGRQRGFNGNIRNFEVIMLPPEATEVPEKTLSFYAKGKMFSTGRGKVGDIECIDTLYVNHDGRPSLKSRVANKDEVRQIAGQLVDESTLSAFSSTGQALRNVVSGGLPELGKH
jgi:hypothetical protein